MRQHKVVLPVMDVTNEFNQLFISRGVILASVTYILIYCYTFTFTMESKTPSVLHKWLFSFRVKVAIDSNYKKMNYIPKHCSL